MKTVGVFTEGGPEIGLGHLSRCYAIACALQQRGCKPVFFIFSDGDVSKVVRPFKARNVDWKLDIESIFKNEQIPFAIIDSYLAPQKVYELAARLLDGHLLIIDDYMRLEYPRSFVVNPAMDSQKLNYPKGAGRKYLLGKDYIILRSDFWEVQPKKIKDKIENIFLTFGGWAEKETLEQVALFIKKHINVNLQMLDSYKKQYSAKQMRRMMIEADLCVSGGGQTIYELTRMGVPTISVTLDDNQALNVKALKQAGFSFSAGRINKDSFYDRLEEGIKHMISPIVRKNCSAIGQKLVDGKGAHRLTDIITEII